MKKKIIVVTGQTATGKTSLAMKLAQEQNGELINCDSRQIYTYLNIITGKDLPADATFHEWKELNDFSLGYYQWSNENDFDHKLWLYDVVNPTEYFSAHDYKQCAEEVIKNIIERGKTPIIVGGTYFYLRYLLYGIDTIHIEPNWELRKELEKETIENLQSKLINLNSRLFEELNESDKKNPRRIIRKIEITLATQQEKKESSTESFLHNFDVEIIGLRHTERESLMKMIEQRVEERLGQGAIAEVERLLQQGFTESDPGLQTIGYKQILEYLKKEISFETMKQQWIFKELQYAKRQYTFIKKNVNIMWQ